MGVDCMDVESGVRDTYESFIWEPVTVKENSINAATEACCLVLSIDETIKNPQSEQPKGKGKGGKGGKGFTGQMQHMAQGGKGKGMRQIQNKLAR